MSTALTGGKKTALCRYFTNTGTCSYGDDCQFLHSTFPPQSIPNTLINGYGQENELLISKDSEGLYNKVLMTINLAEMSN